jgi:hypothetical protein
LPNRRQLVYAAPGQKQNIDGTEEMLVLTKSFASHPLDPVTSRGKADVLARDHHSQAGTNPLIASEKYQVITAGDALLGTGEKGLKISGGQQSSRPGKRCGRRDTAGHRLLRQSGACALWHGDA